MSGWTALVPVAGDREETAVRSVWNRAIVERRLMASGTDWVWSEPVAPSDCVTLVLCSATVTRFHDEEQTDPDPRTFIVRPGGSIHLLAAEPATVVSVRVPVDASIAADGSVIAADASLLSAAVFAFASSLLDAPSSEPESGASVEHLLSKMVEQVTAVLRASRG